MSATEPRPLLPLKPENADKAARVLIESGGSVDALRSVMTGAEVAQIEAAMSAAAADAITKGSKS